MDVDKARGKPPYRKLVSVRRISHIKSLDSSQTHEVAKVDGWPVVVEKGRFAVNQRVLYFAIDRVLPFLDKRYEPYRFSHFLVESHGQKGWAVQTVKYKGHISQGMAFPVNDSFPELICARESIEKFCGHRYPKVVEGILLDLDLKEAFQIRKWITFYPPDGGVSLGHPPDYFKTPKSERVQNIPNLWTKHGNTEFQITEIIDGMPMIYYEVGESGGDLWTTIPGVILGDGTENSFPERPLYGISIGEHDYEETESSMGWKVVREQGMIEDIRGFGEFTLAGVLYGEGISGNPHMIKGRRFSFYSMWDDIPGVWKPVDNDSSRSIESAKQVPTFAQRIRLSAFAKDLDELMMKAQGASCVSEATKKRHPSLKRKGLVFRSIDGSFSFKVIANDWLLGETEKLVSRPDLNDCV